MNRKDFLKKMGLLVTGAVASTAGVGAFNGGIMSCSQQTRRKVIGIQLYSVRQLIDENLQETLKGLADCGYLAVEGLVTTKKPAISIPLSTSSIKCLETLA